MNIKRIELTQGRFAIVDADDFDMLSRFRWRLLRSGPNRYAINCDDGRIVRMHRLILRPPKNLWCDHINGDGLDNRKCNLRVCTPTQNSRNARPRENCTSKYKGVHFSRIKKKWIAKINKSDGRTIHIGSYDFEQDAAIAYDDKAIELFGEFAWLNCTHRPEINQWQQDMYLF